MSDKGDTNAAALRVLLISGFNIENLAALLNRSADGPVVQARCAPFGQVMQLLLDPGAPLWTEGESIAVVWTAPDGVSPAFERLLHGESAEPSGLGADVEAFATALKSVPSTFRTLLVPTWTAGAFVGRTGVGDLDEKRGVSAALMRMNLALAEAVRGDSRIRLLDANRWLLVHGEKSFSARMWYMAKTPYTVDLLKVAAAEIKAALRAVRGQARKLICLDLDDTLWGGIVGDLGWEKLRLGGHDPVGEAHRDFQTALKDLQRSGILLALVSKNEEAVALEAVRKNPEMVLRVDDLAGWRINWDDKARNIADLTAELNLGLQSVVFLDDNPAERARVREALPEVLVPEWPASPMEYVSALQQLRCFDRVEFTQEDRDRSHMYVAERKRREDLSSAGSLEDWLRTLHVRVSAAPLELTDLERATQLFNKTNQLNLSTRRLTKDELWTWSRAAGNQLFVIRVSDKFGDYGLVGVASVTRPAEPGGSAWVADYILSCRVMGRKVEETILHVLANAVRGQAGEIAAEYLPTPKNHPCLRVFEASGWQRKGNTFRWSLDSEYPKPDFIELAAGQLPLGTT